VYCLVRATDETKALERIHDSLKQYKLLETLESVEVDDRVIPIAGDLSKPLLGLEDDVFKMLATEVDAIIHNGAEVNLIKPYSALKSPNVLGTQEVLRLAVTNGIAKTHVKPVHYISTNGVFPSNYKDKTLSETSDLSDIWTDLDNGYSQSKWVAEEMCRQASSRGLPMSILRPGNMAPSSKTGVWNTSDFMYLMLRGCWKLCAVPARSDWYFDMTPVDFAANAIIHLAAINPSSCLGQTLHIQNPLKPVKSDAFFKYVIRTLKATQKTQPRTLEYSKWAVQLEQNKEGDIELEKLSAGLEAFDMYLKSDAIFDATLATALLKKAHVECPVIDQEILQTFIGTWK
jgi:thioester reductase-like protein